MGVMHGPLIRKSKHLPQSVLAFHEFQQKTQIKPLCEEVIAAIIECIGLYTRTYILIDALDECRVSHDGRPKLLQALHQIRNKTGVNLFVTSRYLLEIAESFESEPSLEIIAREKDVSIYIEGRINDLPSFVLGRDDLKQEIHHEVAAAADGM